ncbi:MAG: acyltransferase [Prevotella sp.]|nr:acyltransferase [Candidatus Prevotella equi]
MNNPITIRCHESNHDQKSVIMGGAILMIMLFHSGVLRFGEIGVDIFLFLSGYGLFFSLERNSKKTVFYRKRLLRILPTYLIVAVPYFIVHSNSVSEFLLRLSTLSVLTKGDLGGWWFIGIILVCYLIAPFLYNILSRKNLCFWGLVIYIPLSILVARKFYTTEIMIYRMPSFFCGMIYASLGFSLPCTIKGKGLINKVPSTFISIFTCLGILILLYYAIDRFWTYRHLMMCICSVPLVLSISVIMSNLTGYIRKIFVFLGGITLELYMVHEYIAQCIAEKYLSIYNIGTQISTLSTTCVGIALAVTLAILLNHIISILNTNILLCHKKK